MAVVERPPHAGPTFALESIEKTAAQLAPYVTRTPIVTFPGNRVEEAVGTLTVKLETLQDTGSFKYRGAVNNLLSLEAAASRPGVITVSSGNHGIALSEAARRFGIPATVVMGVGANRYRREQIEARGARVLTAATVREVFTLAQTLAAEQQLTFVHPYDGARTILATASLGLEFIDQCSSQGTRLDAVVLPIGGGGLAAGVALAVKLRSPGTLLLGAEPAGAPTLTRALEAGMPIWLDEIATVADSLGAPFMGEQSFAICKDLLSEVVLLEDQQIMAAVSKIMTSFRLLVEPSAAVSTAAVLGPFRDRLQGMNVGVVFCGANASLPPFHPDAKCGNLE